jgi:hypothetical protein
MRSGGWGQGDGVSERFQLPDVVAGLLVFADAIGVVGAEVAVAGGAVGEQVVR